MRFTNTQLEKVFQRTSGYCHICHKTLRFDRYGCHGQNGCWEVEHSRPQAQGGSHSLNNLYPACIACNRAKGLKSSRTARAQHGKTRAPLSITKRQRAKRINSIKGLVLGMVAGVFINLEVTVALAASGLLVGYLLNPDTWR